MLPVQKPFPIDRQAQRRAAVWSASIEVLATSPVLNSGSLWGLPRALKLAAHLWVAHKGLLAFEVLFVLGMLSFAKKSTIAQARLCTKGAWVHYTVPNAVEMLKHWMRLRAKGVSARPASLFGGRSWCSELSVLCALAMAMLWLEPWGDRDGVGGILRGHESQGVLG